MLNLGVEGMMLVGAVMGFLAVQRVGGPAGFVLPLAIAVAALAGGVAALILAFLVITLRANQIVSGLAITIFSGAAGLSSYLGNDFDLADNPAALLVRAVDAFGLEDLPDRRARRVRPDLARLRLVGLRRRRRPLPLADAARTSTFAPSASRRQRPMRWASASPGTATCTPSPAGRFAGIGGACFSLALTPQWVDGLTAGAGWIAIALVIFAFWRADLCLVGAYVFGAFSALPFTLQARGVTIAPEFFQALPYVMTIVVLVIVSSGARKRRLAPPQAWASRTSARSGSAAWTS